MPDHDVIVVGAGPVGLLLSCLLAARGLDVMLCERRHGIDRADADQRTRAIGIHPPGLAALDGAGVGGEVREEAVRLVRGEVHARGRRLASVPFGVARPVLILPQPRTEALLRTRLRALGVSVRGGREAVGVRQDADQVVLRTRPVDGGRARAESESSASFLIAADGVRSDLRAQLDIPWLTRPGLGRYSMIDLPDPDEEPVAHLFCGPEGLVESFPLPQGRRRWVVRHPAGVDELPGERFTAEVRRRTGAALELPGDREPESFVAAQHRAQRVIDGRIVLLGDAAHEVSPIGGQGMNLGWVDALRLADPLRRSVETGRPALSGFARRSARAVADVHRRARFYMWMGSSRRPAGQAVQEGMIRMLGAPPLRFGATALITMRGV
ncbi:FAD-dependent monooxygenase [Actinomycetales bacterium SN12]|nr:FAD-dependent monooxygenase [Actinomycetales bacterium SN12]